MKGIFDKEFEMKSLEHAKRILEMDIFKRRIQHLLILKQFAYMLKMFNQIFIYTNQNLFLCDQPIIINSIRTSAQFNNPI